MERLTVAMAEWSDPTRCHSARTAIKKKIANYSIEQAVNGTLDALRLVSCQRQNGALSLAGISTENTND